MQNIRLIDFPVCTMIASPAGFFGEPDFDRFGDWLAGQPRDLWPRDFLTMEEGGMRWLYLPFPGMELPAEYETVDFPGGLYVVTTDIDQRTDTAAMYAELDAFLAGCGLEKDHSRPDMGNIISGPVPAETLGYEQMDYYTPVRKKTD